MSSFVKGPKALILDQEETTEMAKGKLKEYPIITTKFNIGLVLKGVSSSPLEPLFLGPEKLDASQYVFFVVDQPKFNELACVRSDINKHRVGKLEHM